MPFLLMNTQCDSEDLDVAYCGQSVVIDTDFFDSAVSDSYELLSVNLSDDCLTIEVSASGCDGESWSMVLVDSGSVAESSPEQRYLKFIFSNDEVCLAVFSQSRSFDLQNLQVEDSNEIVLNIDGFTEPITYTYP